MFVCGTDAGEGVSLALAGEHQVNELEQPHS